jgi:hypothetical protein
MFDPMSSDVKPERHLPGLFGRAVSLAPAQSVRIAPATPRLPGQPRQAPVAQRENGGGAVTER